MRFAALLLVLLAAACAPKTVVQPQPQPPAKPHLDIQASRFSDLPGWQAEGFFGVLPALLKSCQKLKTSPDWQGACRMAGSVAGDPVSVRRFFELEFRPWQVSDNGNPDGLFTGYYESELRTTHVRQSVDQVPILAQPSDLISAELSQFDPALKGKRVTGRVEGGRLVPYYNRAQIENGAVSAKAQVLAWADAVDAHILSIQGSGRLIFEDGTTVRAGFAAANGLPFKGIGSILKQQGKIPPGGDSTMPAIERWLKTHRDEGRRLMAENQRYIFFHKIEGEGPIGSLGVALTPERSLAVDHELLPMGVPVWLSTSLADGQNFQRLMLAQDTGAAIKGAVRGDIFFGTGAKAYEKAGRQKQAGRYWLLLPKNMTPEVALRN